MEFFDDNKKNILYLATTIYNDAVVLLSNENKISNNTISFSSALFQNYISTVKQFVGDSILKKRKIDFNSALAIAIIKTNNDKLNKEQYEFCKSLYTEIITIDNNNTSAKYNLAALEANHALREVKNLILEKDRNNLLLKNAKILTNQKEILLKNEKLEREKLIELAAKENEKQKLEREKQELEIKNQKQIKTVFLICLTLLSVILVFIINSYRTKQKQNKLLAFQKQEITHQKQEIVDSINYAKRIQSAILPSLAEVKQSLPNSFILYKPKDIVSGDFYYFNKVDNQLLIAAADCTGHGVPGAFMSVVCAKELKIANSISNSPAQILKLLNNGVKETLKQNNVDGTKDGMDIALLNIEGTKILYSAANRPLWIVKNNSDSIQEIKATKTAIAGFTTDNFVFEEHELNLSQGDTIYVFSDGYADQFGGEKQKKLTTKRFRELILSIQNKSMNEQHDILANSIETWRGKNEQVDDILVIGVRV